MLFILLLILQIYYLVATTTSTLSGNGSGIQYSDYFIGESNWNSGFISQSHHSFANKYSNYFYSDTYLINYFIIFAVFNYYI